MRLSLPFPNGLGHGVVCRGLSLALLAAGLGTPAWAAAQEAPQITSQAGQRASADFKGELASSDVRAIAEWAIGAGDNRGLPVLIIDKPGAKVFVFDAAGKLLGAAPALLGLARGDTSVPGIGHRRLATIAPEERTTPAGRFQAALGHDFEQDILWIDYDSALSLHRVIDGNPKDRRRQRLASDTPHDNRVSYGCINVPAAFYDDVVDRAFKGTVGIVYILPDATALEEVFPLAANARLEPAGDGTGS